MKNKFNIGDLVTAFSGYSLYRIVGIPANKVYDEENGNYSYILSYQCQNILTDNEFEDGSEMIGVREENLVLAREKVIKEMGERYRKYLFDAWQDELKKTDD